MASPLLTRAQAESLTSQIKSNIQELSELIKKAHDGRIWEALNYGSFSEWVEGELEWSHTRGFQLLNIALLTEAVTDRVIMPDDFRLGDLQTRDIIKFGREEFLNLLESHCGDDPDENESKLVALLHEQREKSEPGSTKVPRQIPPAPSFDVRDGVYDYKTAREAISSFSYQMRLLPDPRKLSPEYAVRCLEIYEKSRTELVQKIAEFESTTFESEVDNVA